MFERGESWHEMYTPEHKLCYIIQSRFALTLTLTMQHETSEGRGERSSSDRC